MARSIGERRDEMQQRRDYLVARLTRIEDHLDNAPNPDWEEAAQEAENDEVMEDLGLAGQEEIRAIDAALARIADGTYGKCVTCGEPISEERLDLLPYTPFCKEHAPGRG
ncbi:MAG: TraR/DksA family transcriptional regulator [Rhizobiaceae bacterium]